MKLHNLRDQNLLRHEMIQNVLGCHGCLVSDSIDLYDLLIISLFGRGLFFVHALELYSVSFGACLSEYRYRWRTVSGNRIKLYKSYVGFIASIARVYLLRKLASRSNLMIVSSEMRRNYLITESVDFCVKVLKNKPVFNHDLIQQNYLRNNSIILIGNMYSTKHDFLKVANYASLRKMNILCYGVSAEDEEWLKSLPFDNLKIFERVNQNVVSDILLSSRYALCLYSNVSINNKFSSSSKVFELLYHGVIPIVSNNPGLLYELDTLGATYILVDNLEVDHALLNNNPLMLSEVCQFGSEINSLSNISADLSNL